jgi:hypothetical protein
VLEKSQHLSVPPVVALAKTFDTVTDSGLLHVFSDQDMERLIRGVHAVLRPSGLYWLMCFSEHATFPGPRRLTQQHIATLFKEGWQIRSVEHAQFEVIAGRVRTKVKSQLPGSRASNGCEPATTGQPRSHRSGYSGQRNGGLKLKRITGPLPCR